MAMLFAVLAAFDYTFILLGETDLDLFFHPELLLFPAAFLAMLSAFMTAAKKADWMDQILISGGAIGGILFNSLIGDSHIAPLEAISWIVISLVCTFAGFGLCRIFIPLSARKTAQPALSGNAPEGK